MTAEVADAINEERDDDQDEQDEQDGEDLLAGIPDDLRFDLDEREDGPEADRTPFALGQHRLYARKPKDYTLLALTSAMSGMADSGDIAYAVMLFCHDAFDGPTRNLVSRLDDKGLSNLIQKLCDKWGEDTSTWNKENRAQRRSAAKANRRRR